MEGLSLTGSFGAGGSPATPILGTFGANLTSRRKFFFRPVSLSPPAAGVRLSFCRCSGGVHGSRRGCMETKKRGWNPYLANQGRSARDYGKLAIFGPKKAARNARDGGKFHLERVSKYRSRFEAIVFGVRLSAAPIRLGATRMSHPSVAATCFRKQLSRHL